MANENPCIPPGRRVYAIGDIHGRADLLDEMPADWETVALMGNHERLMLDSWAGNPKAAAIWRTNGGDATLESYGIDPMDDLASALDAQVPPAHLAYLRALPLTHRIGGYLFVHAGIRPGVALDRQDPHDLIWMREPFLSSEADHGAVVVHGHSPGAEPCVRPNRIGIDTTAFASGVLTCLALEKDRRKFLATGSRALNH